MYVGLKSGSKMNHIMHAMYMSRAPEKIISEIPHLTFSAAFYLLLTKVPSKTQNITEYEKINITCNAVTILLSFTLLRWLSRSLEFRSGSYGLYSVILIIIRMISIYKTQERQQINPVQYPITLPSLIAILS